MLQQSGLFYKKSDQSNYVEISNKVQLISCLCLKKLGMRVAAVSQGTARLQRHLIQTESVHTNVQTESVRTSNYFISRQFLSASSLALTYNIFIGVKLLAVLSLMIS